MAFHRPAQSAVLEGIKRLHALAMPTKRPDDIINIFDVAAEKVAQTLEGHIIVSPRP